jgi:predicted metal-binding membrane protein
VRAASARRLGEPGSPTAAVRAVRARIGSALALLAVAGACWWWAATHMAGMDDGPWSALGSPGWFIATWTVMMAAMMFPSVSPTVALYARMTRAATPVLPAVFTAGYLLVWVASGGLALALADSMATIAGGVLAWDRAGRALTIATLLLAALYEFTPLKNACLGKCRSPLGFLLGTWRQGARGALLMGAKLGAWCLGCCWALMAALFALGVMNIAWMAAVSVLIALEKLLPWRRAATYVTAAVLVAVAAVALIAPNALPGTAPAAPASMMMSAPTAIPS